MAVTPMPAVPQTWHVTGSSPDTRPDPTAGLVRGRNVTFVTDDGMISGTVFAPDSATADAVKAQIAAEVLRLSAIHNLKS